MLKDPAQQRRAKPCMELEPPGTRVELIEAATVLLHVALCFHSMEVESQECYSQNVSVACFSLNNKREHCMDHDIIILPSAHA